MREFSEDDDSIAAMFRDRKVESQRKRHANMRYSTQLLIDEKIPFISKNHGVHLVVGDGIAKFDFYPTTGLFQQRPMGIKGRGVKNLIRIMKGSS